MYYRLRNTILVSITDRTKMMPLDVYLSGWQRLLCDITGYNNDQENYRSYLYRVMQTEKLIWGYHGVHHMNWQIDPWEFYYSLKELVMWINSIKWNKLIMLLYTLAIYMFRRFMTKYLKKMCVGLRHRLFTMFYVLCLVLTMQLNWHNNENT